MKILFLLALHFKKTDNVVKLNAKRSVLIIIFYYRNDYT